MESSSKPEAHFTKILTILTLTLPVFIKELTVCYDFHNFINLVLKTFNFCNPKFALGNLFKFVEKNP